MNRQEAAEVLEELKKPGRFTMRKPERYHTSCTDQTGAGYSTEALKRPRRERMRYENAVEEYSH